ncbi:MAG: hypothetical protein KAV00_09500 [Phycisphaerae bacterium]|nr:hypothetical protein [Phycisphaerae bacterium]
MDQIVTYACDIGSTKRGNFGWVRAVSKHDKVEMRGSRCIDKLISEIGEDISNNHSISIGMECPLFLPIPRISADLSKGRQGEGDRSCFAPAGGYVATLGLHQFAFILKKISSNEIDFTFDAEEWCSGRSNKNILFWEAFVNGKAHAEDHIRDAATAANAFIEMYQKDNINSAVSVSESNEVLSLAGCALLWAGWSQDISLLKQRDVLVVKPSCPYKGPPIQEA